MRTKWFDSVSRSLPLNEYPRPQFARSSWLNLNGQWDYRIRKTSAPDDPSWDGKILVPFCPESELSGVSRVLQPDETLIYRRYFSVPEDWKDSRVILHFGAVDYACELLREQPEIKIRALSAAAGFSSESAFYSAFSSRTGTTPKQWLAENAR